MLGHYTGSSVGKGFYRIFMPGAPMTHREPILSATSHKEFSRALFKERLNKRLQPHYGRDRVITFTMCYKGNQLQIECKDSVALKYLMNQPIGPDLLKLIADEGQEYGVNSRKEMRQYLRGQYTPPECLLDKVMPILMDYLIRTMSFDMTLMNSSKLADQDEVDTSNKLLERYAEIFAQPIKTLIDNDKRTKKQQATSDIEVANSMLTMDLEILEADGYPVLTA